MANAIWNPGISPSNPTLEMIVNQQSQSTEGNYSALAWSLVLHRPSLVSSSASKSYNAKINNVTVASGSTTIGGIGDKLIASGTTIVYHNPDGSKLDVPFNFYMDIGITWSNQPTGNASGAGDIDLTPIPRATTPSLNYSTREMGQVIRITTNPAVAGFSHKIYYSFTGINKTLIAEKPAGNQYHDWTIPLATLAPKIPNSLSGAVTVEVETYSGATLIGTKTVLFTATVPDYQPSASLGVTGIDLYMARYVQGKSKVSVGITADGLYGSTIANYRTVVNGSIYNTANLTTEVLISSGVNVIETTVTDSRGKTRSITQNITVESYQSPQAISLSVARCLADGTLNEEGAFVKASIQAAISSILNTNTKQTLVKYKLKALGTWTIALNNTTDYSVNTSVVFPADTNSQFDVLLEVNDYFNNGVVTRSADIAVAFTLMDFNSDGKGIAIGKVAEGNGVLDIRGDTYTEGNVNVDGPVIATGKITSNSKVLNDIIPAETYLALTDINIFTHTTDQILSTAPLQIAMTKKEGSLSISSNNITLPKGYVYEFMLDMEVWNASASYSLFDLQNSSNVSVLSSKNTVCAGTQTGSSGCGLGKLDLTTASTNSVVRIMCIVTTLPTAKAGSGGGLTIKKYKKITV